MLKKVPVAVQNQTEPIYVNKKKLEFKWGMNVLGEGFAIQWVLFSRMHHHLKSVNKNQLLLLLLLL